jgi:hypothetical protein
MKNSPQWNAAKRAEMCGKKSASELWSGQVFFFRRRRAERQPRSLSLCGRRTHLTSLFSLPSTNTHPPPSPKPTAGTPLAHKTQHDCCAASFGIRGCAFSGGATSLQCWAPDAASKKCTLRRIGQGSCDTGLKGGYQDQGVCQAEEYPDGRPRVAGITYVQRMDVELTGAADIPARNGAAPFTRVCGGKGMFEFTCARTLGCVGYSVDAKELTKGCAYLKRAGGATTTRRGWLTFIKQQ